MTRARAATLDPREPFADAAQARTARVALVPLSGRCALARGLTHTMVDEADFDRVIAAASWSISPNHNGVYVAGELRAEFVAPGPPRIVRLHRWLTDAPRDMVVDHIDGDRLNNTRANLRICTVAENCRNRHARRGASRFKGVSKHCGSRDRWTAGICYNHRNIYLGFFREEEDAAYAYDSAARVLHGEFANLNFPHTLPPERVAGPTRARLCRAISLQGETR